MLVSEDFLICIFF